MINLHPFLRLARMQPPSLLRHYLPPSKPLLLIIQIPTPHRLRPILRSLHRRFPARMEVIIVQLRRMPRPHVAGQQARLQAVDDVLEKGETGGDGADVDVDGGDDGGAEVVVRMVGGGGSV